MTKSASERRGARTRAIVAAAQELTLERGYQGWTLDELAETVGVSRRTLFNYVDSKERAVLGPLPTAGEEALAAFRSGRPTGQILPDLVHLVLGTLEADDVSPTDWERFKDVLTGDDQLLQRMLAALDDLCEQLVEHAVARPGADVESARLAISLAGALVHHGADQAAHAADGSSIADHVRRLLPIASDLLTGSA